MKQSSVDDLMIVSAQTLQRESQEFVEQSGGYAARVVKRPWPKGVGFSTTEGDHTFKLRKCAIQSPDVCLDDKRLNLSDHFTAVKESLKWVWSQVFQNEIISACANRVVVRHKYLAEVLNYPSTTIVNVPFSRRVNFLGKEISPYASGGSDILRWVVNRKYKSAAQQVVWFHPDIVHFLFPDVDHWAADIVWRNILDAETNPRQIGFYRAVLSYAAKPVHPELGWVITVTPPGLRGWLWYWVWKIVRFTP